MLQCTKVDNFSERSLDILESQKSTWNQKILIFQISQNCPYGRPKTLSDKIRSANGTSRPWCSLPLSFSKFGHFANKKPSRFQKLSEKCSKICRNFHIKNHNRTKKFFGQSDFAHDGISRLENRKIGKVGDFKD